MSVESKIAELSLPVSGFAARGWLAALSDAFHLLRQNGRPTSAEKVQQVLMYLNGLGGNGTWLERLEAEKEQMTQRVWDLDQYTHTDEFRALCAHDRELLSNQRVYMELYVECLHQRIGRHIINNRSSPT